MWGQEGADEPRENEGVYLGTECLNEDQVYWECEI